MKIRFLKKQLFFIMLTMFSTGFVFAGNNGSTFFEPVSYFQAGCEVDSVKTGKNVTFFPMIEFVTDQKWGGVDVGVRFTDGSVDFTGSFEVWPLVFKYFRAGLSGTYNLVFYSELYVVHNLMPQILLQFNFGGVVFLGLSGGYIWNFKNEYEGGDTFPAYKDSSYSASCFLGVNVSKKFGFDLSASTYEKFRFQRLGAPTVGIDFHYSFTKNFQMGLKGCVRNLDFTNMDAVPNNLEFFARFRYIF